MLNPTIGFHTAQRGHTQQQFACQQLSSKIMGGCWVPMLLSPIGILIQKIFVWLSEHTFTLLISSQLVHLTVCVNQLTTYHSVVLNSLLYRTIVIVTNTWIAHKPTLVQLCPQTKVQHFLLVERRIAI